MSGTLTVIGLSFLFEPNGVLLIVLSAIAGVFAPPSGPTLRVRASSAGFASSPAAAATT